MPVHNTFYLVNNQIAPHLLQIRGPVLQVQVQIPTALANIHQQQGTPVPQPVSGIAMLDTGASHTCVDTNAITSLGVNPINSVPIQTPSGSATHYLYPAQFAFPGAMIPTLDFSAVVGCPLAGQGIVALIGRDVLRQFVLVYNGPAGLCTLAV